MAPKHKQVGKLPPRYRFAINPFPEVRWSRCPRCDRLSHNRKFPLLIHVEGHGLVILGKTCRYCTRCEFIVAHQDELEHELATLFERRSPEVIGNDYFVAGTVERGTWQKGMKEHLTVEELLRHTADIKEHFTLSDPHPRLVVEKTEPPG